MSQFSTDTILFTAPGCAFCPAVKQHLNTLHKEGLISKLEIFDIQQHPEKAAKLGVRSVPWFKIGELVFTGAHELSELRTRVAQASSLEGIASYIEEQLAEGQLATIEPLLLQHHHWWPALIPVLESKDTPMQVRLGIDAMMDTLAESEDYLALIPELGRLSKSGSATIRPDIIHYLQISQHADAIPYLTACAKDSDPQIRELAEEALQEMNDPG